MSNLASFALLTCLSIANPEAQVDDPEGQQAVSEPEITARLVSSRPRVRPGEWFPVVFLLETGGESQILIGPPDDGLRAPEGAPETESSLNWITQEGDEFIVVPDLTAVQWPRSPREDDIPEGYLELPASIYVPIRAIPDAPLGPSKITFGMTVVPHLRTEDGARPLEPVTISRELEVEVVHPTDPEATELVAVDPTLFFGWHGELPDWTVRAAQPTRGGRSIAPILAWILVGTPFVIVVGALTWAFATKRL